MLIAIGVGFLVIGALWGGAAGGTGGVYYAWLTAVVVLDVFGTLGVVLLSRRSGTLHRQEAARETVSRFAGNQSSAREPGASF